MWPRTLRQAAVAQQGSGQQRSTPVRRTGTGGKRRAGALPPTQTGASPGGKSKDSNKRARRSPAERPAARTEATALEHEGPVPAEDCLSSKPHDAAVKAEVSVDSEVDPARASRVEAPEKMGGDQWTTLEEGVRSEPVAAVRPDVECAFPSERKSFGGEL